MIGFIGLGAAGGNIADEARKNGFPALAINYSQKDLDSLEYVEERLKLVGSEGVGKNREEAVRLMNKNWESVTSFVKENFSTPAVEVIIVSFSTGGGSGSGMAPVLLEILMQEMPEKTFVAAPILPDLTEVIVNQMNCIKTSEELSNVDICVLPLDNEQIRKKYDKQGKNTIFKAANETFVGFIRDFVEYTDKQSKNGVMDKKDLRTLFSTKGVAVATMVKVTELKQDGIDLSSEGFMKAVQKSWNESIFVPIHRDRVVRAGLVFDGQEKLMNFINPGDIFSGFESGMPIDLFEGYYHNESGKIYTMLAGLSWYNARLNKIEEIIKDKQDATNDLLDHNETYQSEVQDISLRRSKSKKPNSKRSVSDILSRYQR